MNRKTKDHLNFAKKRWYWGRRIGNNDWHQQQLRRRSRSGGWQGLCYQRGWHPSRPVPEHIAIFWNIILGIDLIITTYIWICIYYIILVMSSWSPSNCTFDQTGSEYFGPCSTFSPWQQLMLDSIDTNIKMFCQIFSEGGVIYMHTVD